MKNYSENRKEHLCKYAKEKGLPVGGKYHGKESKWKNLILTYTNTTKIEAIQEFNLLNGLHLESPFPIKLHECAHHLSSSQILCYNFFRPLLDKDGHPLKRLIEILHDRGIKITPNAICEFEYDGYNSYKDEGTEFDFHINDVLAEVFIEVKYTEREFAKAKFNSKCKNGETHYDKFNHIYKDMIFDCTCLKDRGSIANNPDEFFNNYQLFRNVIRITDKSKYTIFLFPKEHEKLNKEYKFFKKKYIAEEYKNNVIAAYWEDLVRVGEFNDLFEKYFMED